MKTFIISSLFIFFTLVVFSQEKDSLKAESVQDSSAFKICNEKEMYMVQHMFLEDLLGKKLKKPKTKPEYKGEFWKLKRFFTNNSFDYNRAKGMVFRVTIAFIVNCEGKAGNFVLVSEHEGKELNMANDVIKTAKRLPLDWIPATKKKKNVDCWFMLSFTIFNGEYTSVFWDY